MRLIATWCFALLAASVVHGAEPDLRDRRLDLFTQARVAPQKVSATTARVAGLY